jgi:arabinofuranosyltransferase
MTWFSMRPLAGLTWRQAAPWLVTACTVALFLWEFTAPIVQADDAFISYRYAVNLATGHGLVFNPGEYVEGFTNLLWTLLVAAGIRLGLEAPTGGLVLSLVFGALTLVMVHLYTARFLPRRFAWAAAAAPLVLLASNSFVCWMSTGLETPLFLCLSVAALLSFDMGRPLATAALCVLLFLTRPEGGVEAGVLLGATWIMAMMQGPYTVRRVAAASLPPLIFVAAVVLVTIFRLAYYGDWVPNTFHAKVGQIPIWQGVLYVERFFDDGNLLLLPGAALGIVLVARLRIPALFALITVAYTIMVGGDVFSHGRFLLPIFPVLLAAAIAACALLIPRSIAAAGVLGLLVPATALANLYNPVIDYRRLPFSSDYFDHPHYTFPYSYKRARAKIHYFIVPDEQRVVDDRAAAIQRARPGSRLIACVGIGKLAYYHPEFTILDMVGLTDRHIAESTKTLPDTLVIPGHSRTDSDYVLSRQPDIIILPDLSDLKPGRLPVEADMLSNPKLPQQYRFDTDGRFWVRK